MKHHQEKTNNSNVVSDTVAAKDGSSNLYLESRHKREVFSCCKKGYPTEECLMNHFQKDHPNETLTLRRMEKMKQYVFVCGQCSSFGFSNANLLISHLDTLHGIRPEKKIKEPVVPPNDTNTDADNEIDISAGSRKNSLDSSSGYTSSEFHSCEETVVPAKEKDTNADALNKIDSSASSQPRENSLDSSTSSGVSSESKKRHSRERTCTSCPCENQVENEIAGRQEPKKKKLRKEMSETVVNDNSQASSSGALIPDAAPTPAPVAADLIADAAHDLIADGDGAPEEDADPAPIVTVEGKIECHVCGDVMDFRTKAHKDKFRHHMEIHERKRPYVCPYCLSGFASDIRLLSHVSVHNGDHNFDCAFCRKKFKTKTLLIQHNRSCKE